MLDFPPEGQIEHRTIADNLLLLVAAAADGSGLPYDEGHGRRVSLESSSDAESPPSTPSRREEEPELLTEDDPVLSPPRRFFNPNNDSLVDPDDLLTIMAAIDFKKKDSIRQHIPLPVD